MFVKKVRKQNGVTKKDYEYLHLVESVRTEKGPRQRLILNLGKLDILPSQYQAFAKRVEDLLTGQRSIVGLDQSLEKSARGVARKIFKKQSESLSETTECDFESVDVNSFEIESPRSLGPEYMCHSVWKDLRMGEFFLKQGVSDNVLPLLEALIVGRLIDPGSERYTKEWVEKRSSLFELTGFPLRSSLNSYYRAGDTLFSLKKALEEYLCMREKDIFSLSEKLFFLDLTNSYFEGQAEGNPKATWGHSKEKRSDCKLVSLGLIIDELGFAKYSELFAGNQHEADVLSVMINSLEQHLEPQTDRTVVIDAGIATDENIDWLKNNQYHYIAVNRGAWPFKQDYSEMKVIREDKAKGIKIEVKRFVHQGEIYILCRSEKKVKKEQSMRTRVEELFLDRLSYYKAGLDLPHRTKKYTKALELVGRLKEKYPKAAKLYNVEVIPEAEKQARDKSLCAVDIVWEKKDVNYEREISHEGSYILRTDRVDLSDEEIWNIYIMLRQIEDAFKSMKSSLGLRPNFHQKEDRVDTHMFISVAAYHILHIIENRLRANGDRRNWNTIRNVLSTHERLTIGYKVKEEDGSIRYKHLRLNSKLEPEHVEIYKMFNLSGVPLPSKRLVYNQ
ncbi:MAG: IS1634 family transposase [Acidobacteria bacterium]|nr:IS1634 family transposase [Acidobacteriota bacterium]